MTLSRFYALHTIILPAATFLLILLHVYAFRRAQPAGPYRSRDGARTEPFYPKQFFFDSLFAVMVFAILAALAVLEPATLEPRANPSDVTYLPRPEWYFMPMFQLLKIFQGEFAMIGAVIIPGVVFALFFLLPFIDRSSQRNPFRRPVAVLSMTAILAGLGGLFLLAKADDGAFLSGAEAERLMRIPPDQLSTLSQADSANRLAAANRLQLQRQSERAARFLAEAFRPYQSSERALRIASLPAAPASYVTHCADCHGGIGDGGSDGPDLIAIGEKYTSEQLHQLLLDPAQFDIYDMVGFSEDIISTDERNELVTYLLSLSGS
jgi:ubiquinol-cytochrome c reductase cytochrome b subunit